MPADAFLKVLIFWLLVLLTVLALVYAYLSVPLMLEDELPESQKSLQLNAEIWPRITQVKPARKMPITGMVWLIIKTSRHIIIPLRFINFLLILLQIIRATINKCTCIIYTPEQSLLLTSK